MLIEDTTRERIDGRAGFWAKFHYERDFGTVCVFDMRRVYNIVLLIVSSCIPGQK